MEIAPGVHRIQCNFDGSRMAFVHLFVGEEAALLVDTCCAHNPQQEILPYMNQIGLDTAKLKYIVISHSDLDHQGGCRPMREAAPHAVLMCHNLDQPWIDSTEALIRGRYMQFDADHGYETSDETIAGMHAITFSHPVDMTLEGGERFRLSADWTIEVMHTPGHTWGHLSVFDPRSKTMAAGEAALWNAILGVDWSPALPPTYCYVDTYLATIDRLMSMDIEIYSSAHWPIQRGLEISEFLRESRNYCLNIERQLLALAQQGAFTLKQAIEALAESAGSWPDANDSLLTYPFAGNLNRLVQRKQLISGRNSDNLIVWSLP